MSLFQKLTPTKTVELKAYEDAIDYAFADRDVKNIAVSGPYSAGKSSVIETYKCEHRKLTFLHVSLAHFESPDVNENESNDGNKVLLEGKILNQLIHQIPSRKIPSTNFKVKRTISKGRVLGNTTMLVILITCSAYLRFSKQWTNLISGLSTAWIKHLLIWTTNSSFMFFGGLIGAIALVVSVYKLVGIIMNTQTVLKRVKVQGNEIEVLEQSEDSYFDKYLNEVLYLFDNSGADAVVFEDMDRYDSNRIFEKLKEINTLVNLRRSRDDNPPIRFLYLLRDDLFVTKDRTKFFDLIIPVVPVIDSSNSHEKFIEYFQRAGIYEFFDATFLQRLSLYVDDLRLLKNICNEFIIYLERIESIELNRDKLLALITYKNIFPRDFSDLQLNKGFVYTVFKSKDIFVESEIQRINHQIRDLEPLISKAQCESLNDLDELDAVYFLADKVLSVNNTRESQFATRAEFLRAVKANPSQVRVLGPYNNWQSTNVEAEFTNLSNNEEYVRRRDVIEVGAEHYIDNLKSSIEKLREQQESLRNRRLREVITRENVKDVFSVSFETELGHKNNFEDIKESQYFDLIKFLIRNGYIDETYSDYMTYFYENSLSRTDKIFLRSITDQSSKEYTYTLKDPKMVLSRLGILDFDQQEILNFDLLCYLLETQEVNSAFLRRMLQQLMNTKNFKFVGEFLSNRFEHASSFVRTMNHLWQGIFKSIVDESELSMKQITNYAIDTLLYSTDEDIMALDESGCLSEFISTHSSFLAMNDPNVEKIIHGFSLIDVQFRAIDYATSNKDLFLAVYENNMYRLDFGLISLMLEAVYELPINDNFYSRNYTLVMSKPEEALAKYIKRNMNEYIRHILNHCHDYIDDDESATVEILNHPNIDVDKKITYITRLQTELIRIVDVDDHHLWSTLLHHGRIRCSEENILNYFAASENELDEFLITFINSGTNDLKFNYSLIEAEWGKDSTTKFCEAIVTCGNLDDERYEAILRSLNIPYKSFSFKEIEADKVSILVDLGVIPMNDSNLLFMREHYPDHIIQFIVENIDEYTERVLDEDNFDLHETLLLLEEDVDDEQKVKLLEQTAAELSIKGKKYSDKVKIRILSHNLDREDVPFLLKMYPDESTAVRTEIGRVAVDNITEIIVGQYFVPVVLLSELLVCDQLEEETRKELFSVNLPELSKVEVTNCLRLLQLDDFLNLFDGKRPKVEATSTNKRILSFFEKNGWLTQFYIDAQEPAYYRAVGRRGKNKVNTTAVSFAD